MSTQRAIGTYEEIIDLHTEAGSVSVIGIHTPTGDTPYKMMPGFFDQFKKYKYLGCSIALVPAATLPADPEQISYEAGEPGIDPRDMLNPVLWHGCHGNDLGNILNRLYNVHGDGSNDLSLTLESDSVALMQLLNGDGDFDPVDGNFSPALDILEKLYYRALTDNTWKKAGIQRGFRKSGLHPRVYSLATTTQIMPGTQGTIPAADGPEIWIGEGAMVSGHYQMDLSSPGRVPNQIFTPRTVPLGWMDTRSVVGYQESSEDDVDLDDVEDWMKSTIQTVRATMPKIFMGVILLPPAYKTEFYFRMIVRHTFAFAGFRGVSMGNDMLDAPTVHDWNDKISSGEVPPEPEPIGGDYQLTDLYAAGAPNIGSTPYNTYEKVWIGGQYFGTVTGTSGGLTFDSGYFLLPQSVAMAPTGADPLGYDIFFTSGTQKREFVGYNGDCWSRYYDGSTWGAWSSVAADSKSLHRPTVSVSSTDATLQALDIGGTTTYFLDVTE